MHIVSLFEIGTDEIMVIYIVSIEVKTIVISLINMIFCLMSTQVFCP
jgi:hypothetical protein